MTDTLSRDELGACNTTGAGRASGVRWVAYLHGAPSARRLAASPPPYLDGVGLVPQSVPVAGHLSQAGGLAAVHALLSVALHLLGGAQVLRVQLLLRRQEGCINSQRIDTGATIVQHSNVSLGGRDQVKQILCHFCRRDLAVSLRALDGRQRDAPMI